MKSIPRGLKRITFVNIRAGKNYFNGASGEARLFAITAPANIISAAPPDRPPELRGLSVELTAERYRLTAPVEVWLCQFGEKVTLSRGEIVTIDRKSRLCFDGEAYLLKANPEMIKRRGERLATTLKPQ